MTQPDFEHSSEAGEIKRPVTKEVLTQAANAGYASEVLRGWGMMPEGSLDFAEGMSLVQMAFAVSAQRLDSEANTARNLANQSDDPKWRQMFTDEENRLRARAESERDGIRIMGESVKDHQERTLPRDIIEHIEF